MPKTIYLNNSSLPYLSCSRWYHLRTATGLKPPPGGNKYTNTGLVFHDLMKTCSLSNPAQLKTLMPAAGSLLSSLPPAQQSQVGLLADQIFAEHPEMFEECVKEIWFDDPYPSDNLRHVHLCGTIDLLSFSPEDNTVIITDYKTTSKPLDATIQMDYALTSQRWFYSLAAILFGPTWNKLPDKFKSALAEGRVKWRYCFVNYDKLSYLLQPAEYLSSDDLDLFRRMLHEKVILAAAVHADPTLAIPEGTLAGLCWKCPFKLICVQNTEEQRNNLITNWPYGNESYYPKHD